MEKQASIRKKYQKQKINTYVTIQTAARLRDICEQYGFDSIYQLLQYLIQCFLKVADPQGGPEEETIPEEIAAMFTSNADWENRRDARTCHDGMTIKKKPDQRKIKSANDL